MTLKYILVYNQTFLGNHAQALAYHGKDLGIPITVVMPIVAPIMKVHCKILKKYFFKSGYKYIE